MKTTTTKRDRIHPGAYRKAQRIIGVLCMVSYLAVNTKAGGGLYKKHRPYSVPQEARDILDCLNTDDAEGLCILLLDYNQRQLLTT